MPEYIYLIHLREFLTQNKSIFKIGKTKQINEKRFNSYPKGSELKFLICCNNCDNIEKILITKFKNSFTQQKNYGTEYFKGNYLDMIDMIYKLVIEQNKLIVDNFNIDQDKIKLQNNNCYKKINNIINWIIDNINLINDKDKFGYTFIIALYNIFKSSTFYFSLNDSDQKRYTKKFFFSIIESDLFMNKYADVVKSTIKTITD